MYHFNIYVLASIVAVISCIVLGWFVYAQGKDRKTNRFFSYVTLLVGLWCFFPLLTSIPESEEFALTLGRITYLFGVYCPTLFLHFILVTIGLENRAKEKVILTMAYVISTFFALFVFSDYFIIGITRFAPFFAVIPGALYKIYVVLFTIICLYGFYNVIKVYSFSNFSKKMQIKYLMVAFTIAFISAQMHLLTPYIKKEVFPHDFLVIFYFSAMAYAIVRYQLMDIRIAVSRAAIFAVVYGIVMGIPFVMARKFGIILFSRFGLTLAVGIILAGVSPFIYIKLQRRAEVALLREENKRHQALNVVSRNILRFNRLNALLMAITHSLIRIMQLKMAAIYLADEDKKTFLLKSAWQPPFKNPDLPKDISFNSVLARRLFRKGNKALIIDEVKFHSQEANALEVFELKQIFDSLKAQLVIPAYRTGKIVGFLALGEKRTERGYSREDIEVLTVLANHATLAIENAVFNEQERERQAIFFHSASLASLGTMASMMGHQVNNRFQAVNNLSGSAETLELLLNSKDNFSVDEYKKLIQQAISSLRRISDEAVKGGEIVASIRRLSRLSSEEFKPTTIKEVLDIALGVLRYKIKFDEFDFKQDVPDALPKIMGDSTQLGEVFFNLIDNAYDAIKERREANAQPDYQPRISIVAYIRKDTKYLHIDVSDTGMGIKDDFMPKLFVPFYTTKASSGKGTGLGLHVIKRIIEFHKGKISVESKHGEGTTFKIELPVAEEGNKKINEVT